MLPKDCKQRIAGSTARGIVHYKLPKNHWDYHEITGTDHGTDFWADLIENGEYKNNKIEGQIKGTKSPKKLEKENAFTFNMDVKTINYGLGSKIAYVLFYVDNKKEIVYYLPIQDYFISNPILFDRLEKNKTCLAVHIPCDNILSMEDYDLQQIAKSTYVGGATRQLRKVNID